MDSYWDSIKNEHVPKKKISKSDKKKDNKNLLLSIKVPNLIKIKIPQNQMLIHILLLIILILMMMRIENI